MAAPNTAVNYAAPHYYYPITDLDQTAVGGGHHLSFQQADRAENIQRLNRLASTSLRKKNVGLELFVGQIHLVTDSKSSSSEDPQNPDWTRPPEHLLMTSSSQSAD